MLIYDSNNVNVSFYYGIYKKKYGITMVDVQRNIVLPG